MALITLRPASIADCEILLEWRNDPLTRSLSHSMGEVLRDDHVLWLKAALGNPNRHVYIAEEAGAPVGTVRADVIEGVHELSWTVAPAARGRGIGKAMVCLLANTIQGPITAAVKIGNTASVQIAEAVGMVFETERDGILYFRRTPKRE